MADPGSIAAVTDISHWWHQEELLAKIALEKSNFPCLSFWAGEYMCFLLKTFSNQLSLMLGKYQQNNSVNGFFYNYVILMLFL